MFLRDWVGTEQWRRNNLAAATAHFLLTAGFTFTIPFLPLYIQEISDATEEQASFWAGLATGLGFLASFFAGPFWGALGDRFGRKALLMRAAFGASLGTLLFAFVTNIPELVVLRFFFGLMAGSGVASMALVAAYTPTEKLPQALGTQQAASLTGSAIGPAFGGTLVATVGFQWAFILTSLVMFAGSVSVLLLAKEDMAALRETRQRRQSSGLREIVSLLRSPAVLTTLGLIFLLGISRPITQPVLPGFIKSLMGDGSSVTFAVSAIFAGIAIAGAISALAAGRLIARHGVLAVALVASLAAAVLAFPQAAAQHVGFLAAFVILQALTYGGIQTSTATLLTRSVPPHAISSGFGLFQSVQSLSNGAGPFLGGAIAVSLGFRPVFVVAGVIFLIAAAASYPVLRRLDTRSTAT